MNSSNEYSEKDLKAIVSRATALQREAGELNFEAVGSGQKLTQEEVEHIASEAGLSPAYVKQAMLEFEGIPLEDSFFIETFDKNQIEIAGYAPGKADRESVTEIMSLIRAHYKMEGEVDVKTDGLLWSDKGSGDSALPSSPRKLVQVSSTGGRLRIRIREKVRWRRLPDIPAWMCLIAIVLIAQQMLVENEAAPLFAIIIAGAFSLLFFNWTEKLKAKARKKMSRLMKDIQQAMVRRQAGRVETAKTDKTIIPDSDAGFREEEGADTPASLKNQLR